MIQLTKTLKKEIQKIYDTWIHSYLNADVSTYDSYFDDAYHFIGSTNNEEFLNRKETTKFFKNTAQQFAGKTDLRNQTTTLESFGELIFITHIFDAWFLNGKEWTSYSRFRFSSVLKEKEEGWKFIYQHFSIADSKTDDGQTIGFDKVNLENQELREAIKRRTFELEEKNRELEVEGTLERIRAQAVAMKQSSDLLDIVVTMRKEFIKLGHEAHYFWHMMWLPEVYEKAMTSGDGTKIGFVMELPRHIHGDIPLLAKWEKSKKPTAVYAMNVEDALDYVHKMVTLGNFKNIDPQAPTEDNIRHIGGLTFIMARTSHGEIGYSLPGVVKNPPQEDIDILVKFAGAFDLAHRRFLDLQKAEKQARETLIELALEKVRSRTMGMRRSDELRDTAMLLFQQVEELGINSFACGFNIWDEDKQFATAWMASKDRLQPPFRTDSSEDVYLLFHEAEKRGDALFVLEQEGKELEDHYKYLVAIPEVKALANAGLSFPAFQIIHCAYFSKGYLMFITHEAVPDAHDIFKRFAKVFQQTYTRFLDLQKAEAQVREAQIEMALEKVRSRTMAMQHSDELPEAANNLFLQVQELGIPAWSAGYCIWDEDKKNATANMSSEGVIQKPFILPIVGEGYNFKKPLQNGESFHVGELAGKAIVKHYEFMRTLPIFGEILDGVIEAGFPLPTFQIFHIVYFDYGYVMFITYERVPEAHDIFIRFGKVFKQTYTRFLELQRAEAQAKEAQIETALEKVRSRTMAMQKGEELQDVVVLLYKELIALGVTNFATCGYVEINETTNKQSTWVTSPGGDSLGLFHLPLTGDVHFDARYDAWKKQQTVFHQTVAGKERRKHLEYAITTFNSKEAEEMVRNQFPDPTVFYCFNFSHGYLHLVAGSQLTQDEEALLARFTRVFEQTYARFLDLQKAESQTREAQISLAVERVRAKALAMHKSEEIMQVVAKLKAEVMALDIPDVISATIFLNEGDDKVRMWDLSSLEKDNDGYEIPFDITFKLKKRDPHLYIKRVWENPDNYFFEKQETKDFKRINAWLRENDKHDIADEIEVFIDETQLKCLHHAVKKLNNGKLVIDLLHPPSEEMENILTKMGAAFDLAYKRFEDLQKAEKHALEAKIEASLEKVRTVALTLKKSDDMLDIAQVLYEQLLVLGFTDMRNAIIDIHNDDNETFLDYDYSHDMSSAVTLFSFYGDPVIEQQIKKVQSSNDAFFEIELKGDELKELIKTRLRNGEKDDPRLHEIDQLTYNLYSFGNGAIGISNFGILNDVQKKILKRFRNVFTFAYKRYTDLAKSEAQVREAKIESSLEKVRNVALSMTKSENLLDIVKELYKQLLELGFNDIRNAIIDVNNEDEQTFMDYDYSHEMGGTVTLMSYDDDPTLEEQLRVIATTTDGFSEMILEGKLLQDLIDMRRKNGEADDPRLLKTDRVSYILYAFGNGAIGISNFGVLTENQKTILNRFRNVFTFAYQRYTDLAQSEAQATALLAEKQRLEKTLTDLQATQKQLIQSEKMASLGELTAGIAHEIQNPLNFVNNFSEVSKELLDEMLEEIENGDMEEVRAIMADVIQNLEKINHHGKRADGIVKGMLQHSRASGDKKEPTNINALADEYFRLAYHGLRAKDKSFNAHLETDYDDSIKTVAVISQDIGRVILNLFTNAFYAVDERNRIAIDEKKSNSELKYYKPTVSVSTKKLKDKVVITVQDNGNGIPKHIIDKIFQPFFTTKPTGKGTGLGLSMSYDIIKAHEGELNVETKEGEGTTFNIQLPL